VKDLDAAAQSIYESFKSASNPCDFANVESVRDHLRYLASKDTQGIVAVDSSGKIIGSNFVEMSDSVAGIGPLSVVPHAQKQNVGKSLLEQIYNVVKSKSALKSVFMCTRNDPTQSKFLSPLGFKHSLEVSDLRGFIPSTTTVPHGYYVRVMTANDLYAIDVLVSATTGYSRKNKLLNSLKGHLPRFVVLHEDEDAGRRIVGFTTGFHLAGFSIAENEDALKSLIITYSQSYEYIKSKKDDSEDTATDDKGDGPSIVVQVLSSFPNVAKWLSEQGFKLHSRRFIGVAGKYQEPKNLFVPGFQF